MRNDYEVSVRVRDLEGTAGPVTLGEYRLTPDEAFDETEGFKLSAADLHWASAHTLIFLSRSEEKMQLMAWQGPTDGAHKLGSSHDRIVINVDDPLDGRLSLVVSDFIDRPTATTQSVPDNSWRIRDGYRFIGAFKNPKTTRWLRSQKCTVSLDLAMSLRPQGEVSEDYESTPAEWRGRFRSSTVKDDSTITVRDQTLSPDGSIIAMVESASLNLRQPDKSYSSSRIVIKRGRDSTPLVPFAQPRRMQAVLGWSSDGQSLFYLDVGPKISVVNQVSLRGEVRTIYSDNGQLEVPGDFYDRKIRVFSREAASVLLVRSTNVSPAELIEVNLAQGKATVVDAPNVIFSKRAQPKVEFYSIEAGGKDVYGRLYLPLGYQAGHRYPLVITQYYSRPGFYASTGDEVPILPLTANGIAVFTMHSHELGQASNLEDFRTQISRVRRPLEGMEWIVHKLVTEGIVDANRVGVTGLSYGAEIALYAYWRSGMFRAVSVASGSWDPAMVPFGGVDFATFLQRSGFPLTRDANATRLWRELSVGLNAKATLPPLMLQTGDHEENFTVPTWFELRRAGAAVEWYEYPNEGHNKRSPANKWWVYSRNLDWFRFWLKDEEDPDLSKAEQYQRWREMRAWWGAAKTSASEPSVSLK